MYMLPAINERNLMVAMDFWNVFERGHVIMNNRVVFIN